MSKKFSLLQQLDGTDTHLTTESPFPPGVEYQEYILQIEGKDQVIFIPSRECDAFEATLLEHTKDINDDDFRSILRKFRGIRD